MTTFLENSISKKVNDSFQTYDFSLENTSVSEEADNLVREYFLLLQKLYDCLGRGRLAVAEVYSY